MIRREGKGPPSSDLLVCFPRRAHLALMAKPACSPRQNLQRHYQNHLRKSTRRGRSLSIGGGHASPYALGSDSQLSEPTSPKVTCAGQIKVRPSTKSCKNWQSVMEEIERMHNNDKKKSSWVETLGFKKEVMHFLSCLRKLKFDFHCVGAFSHVDISSDEEEEDEDNNDIEINQNNGKNHHEDDDHDLDEEDVNSSRTVFSKWFMVLQENQECEELYEKEGKHLKLEEKEEDLLCPPPNALLLMRCRSAPAKSWMEEKEEEEQEKDDVDNQDDHEHEHDKENDQLEIKKESKRKSLMELMQNDQSDFYKLSCDIAKETWVIGGIHKDPFSRSRSWKR